MKIKEILIAFFTFCYLFFAVGLICGLCIRNYSFAKHAQDLGLMQFDGTNMVFKATNTLSNYELHYLQYGKME